MTGKPKHPHAPKGGWQVWADNHVSRTLLIAGRTVDAETHRRIVSCVRKAFAPPDNAPFCHHPEECAGNSYCKEEIACNE